MSAFVESLVRDFSCAAILALLALGGVGLPVPEDLVVLTSGALVHQGRLDARAAAVACGLGVLAGDALLFQIGRRLGSRAMELAPLARLLGPRRRRALEAHYARHPALTVMAGRFAAGLRLPFYALAGASGVPWRVFLAADAAAALVSVPLMLGLGWAFASALDEVHRRLKLAGAALVASVLLALALAAVRRRRRAAGPAPDHPFPPLPGRPSGRGGPVLRGTEAGPQGARLPEQRQVRIGAPPVGEEPVQELGRLGAPPQARQR